MTQSLLFPSDYPLTLRAYSDADWANDLDTQHSTIGFFAFFLDHLLFLGVASVKTLLPDLVLRLSIEQ